MTMLRFLTLNVMLAVPSMAAGTLDPIHVEGMRLRDSSGRVMILRGVVTITMNNDGKPMVMTGANYDQIKSWGYNVQQIRLGACPLALLPPCNKPDPDYMAKLESWVTMAEERGIYTIFKATTYDIPGLGFKEQFRPGAWDKFWDTASGLQDQFIAGWKPVWEHFKGRSSVIGYDILNETNPGSNTPHFNHDYLFPFYRKAQAALLAVDPEKLMVYQPALRADDREEALGGTNVLFAPHFYPSTDDPEGMWHALLSNGEKSKAAMLIGEYGLPNTAYLTIKATTPERDHADAALFDHASLGTIKTWYTSVGNWSLLLPDGGEHPRMQIFVRPYPQRTAGVPGGFNFDFETHGWTCQWLPDASLHAPTTIFIPAKRHYGGKFRVVVDDSLQLAGDRASATGLKVVINPKQMDATKFQYDWNTEILTVGDPQTRRIVVHP